MPRVYIDDDPPPRPPQELSKTKFIDRGLQEPNGVCLCSTGMKILINVEIETSS